jgi:hypothetical protein
MGMRDESWCMSCGKSQPYQDSDVTCGECENQYSIDFIESFLTYLGNQVKELESKKFPDGDTNSVIHMNGQILATKEILLELEDRFRNE